ncbi:MAG: GNAT family N-acetyltransferase [Longimicrobiales bacterium]
MITILREIGDHADVVLELEQLAAADYLAFVYDHAEQARAVQRLLFASGEAEFSPPGLRVAVMEGRCVGMLAWLTGREVGRRRLANAMTLARARDVLTDGTRRRMTLASRVLARPRDADSYLARIAVSPSHRGAGIGSQLLQLCLDESWAAGADRCLLTVAPDNERAIAMYERCGFRVIGNPRTDDEATGRSFTSLHLAVDRPSNRGARAPSVAGTERP